MPVTTRSQATLEREATSTNMEGRFAKMEECRRKLITDMEAIQRKNDVLRQRNAGLRRALGQARPSNLRIPPERHVECHLMLRGLMGKHKEMAKRMGGSSSVDQLLSSTNIPYSIEVMAITLRPKFRTPQIKMHNRFKDLAKHLEISRPT